jgi:hypothetical protein
LARYDFPLEPSLAEAVAWMDQDPSLAALRQRIVRWHGVNLNDLRVVPTEPLWPQDRKAIEAMWKLLKPKGKVEYLAVDASGQATTGAKRRAGGYDEHG